jgi:glycosyltransferase involved in cell wall biosynthesis
METAPLVSILMPVYNGRDYLRPAIDSLLSQTFRDFELVIVNDGSKDDSQDIIDSYKDPRIVSVKQENQGVARSLNNGLKIAKGKYVRRHDADDISTPESLKIQVDFLEKHPEYVMVCNQQAFMTSNGKIAMNFRVPNNKFFNGLELKDLSFSDFRADSSSPVVHGTACFRRQDVIDLGCYRTEFIVSEDNDLWLRLLEKHKIAVLNVCNYFMRIHPGSATHQHANKIQHFRNLLVEYSEQRRTIGTDPIMRGEKPAAPPPPKPVNLQSKIHPRGKYFREDMRYMYSLVVNAGDSKLMRKMASEIIRDGWKDIRTWKMLMFPLIGERFVKLGVRIKGMFR